MTLARNKSPVRKRHCCVCLLEGGLPLTQSLRSLCFVIVAFFCLACFAQNGSDTVWMSSPAEAQRIARFEAGIPTVDIKGQPPIKLTPSKK